MSNQLHEICELLYESKEFSSYWKYLTAPLVGIFILNLSQTGYIYLRLLHVCKIKLFFVEGWQMGRGNTTNKINLASVGN